MPDFADDAILPDMIARGMVGGLSWKTTTVYVGSGAFSSNQEWETGIGKWDCAINTTPADLFFVMRNFFHAVARGGARGFRFLDKTDKTVHADEGVLVWSSARTWQLAKQYGFGGYSFIRPIKKPYGEVAFFRGGSPGGGFTLDLATGLVTIDVLTSHAIETIAKGATTAVQTVSPHGFAEGLFVTFSGISTMVELNGLGGRVHVVDSTNFTVPIDSTGFTDFSSSGNVETVDTVDAPISWAGQFHVPVKFVGDDFNAVAVQKSGASLIYQWPSFSLQEMRDP